MVQLPFRLLDPGAISLLRLGLVIDNDGRLGLLLVPDPDAIGGDARGQSSSEAREARAKFRGGRGGKDERESIGRVDVTGSVVVVEADVDGKETFDRRGGGEDRDEGEAREATDKFVIFAIISAHCSFNVSTSLCKSLLSSRRVPTSL